MKTPNPTARLHWKKIKKVRNILVRLLNIDPCFKAGFVHIEKVLFPAIKDSCGGLSWTEITNCYKDKLEFDSNGLIIDGETIPVKLISI